MVYERLIKQGVKRECTPAKWGLGAELLQDKLLDRIPLHRIGEVEDVGLAALYLCSRNCYVTGHVLNIDGGRS